MAICTITEVHQLTEIVDELADICRDFDRIY